MEKDEERYRSVSHQLTIRIEIGLHAYVLHVNVYKIIQLKGSAGEESQEFTVHVIHGACERLCSTVTYASTASIHTLPN